MKSFANKISIVSLLGVLATGQALAHQTYNITTYGSNGLGLANSINNTDGISNTNGYSVGNAAASANNWIPGTGGLPADVTSILPFNWYAGHHDTTLTGTTTRSQSTGSSEVAANSLWKAAYTDTANSWAAYAPATTKLSTTAQHPYLAVGADSWKVGSTAGGLDYGLIHAQCGTNDATQNCTTAAATANGGVSDTTGGYYDIKINVSRDATYNALSAAGGNSLTSVNDPNALLDVALYRGADLGTGIGTSRTAAFDPNAAGVQGSTLGTGNESLLWIAHQTQTTDVLSFDLKMTASEWALTDGLDGIFNNGSAGYYTLLIGANGGVVSNGIAYTVSTVSTSVVPIPGAVWLFGSVLGAFGVLRSRNSVLASSIA